MNSNENPNSGAPPQAEIKNAGGCEPNTGPGGYGVVLVHPRKRTEANGGFKKTTYSRMEILAAIAGLELLKQPCKVSLSSYSENLLRDDKGPCVMKASRPAHARGAD